MHTLKLNNHHKPRPTECKGCGRKLPKRAYKHFCATCIKLVDNWGKDTSGNK